MNSKLKRLTELQKLLPPTPCAHPRLFIQHNDETSREVERLRAEMETCVTCREKGAKMLAIVLTRANGRADIESSDGQCPTNPSPQSAVIGGS
jgi:hypothetical protein